MADESDATQTFRDALLSSGSFQTHRTDSLATELSVRQVRSIASAAPPPDRPVVMRCADGIVVIAPSRTDAYGGTTTVPRIMSLKQSGWDLQVFSADDGDFILAWKEGEPGKSRRWSLAAKEAAAQLLVRVKDAPPTAVIGVVAKQGAPGVDEIGLVLSESASSRLESQILSGGDITVDNRIFLVDTFRYHIPEGFRVVSTGSSDDTGGK